jgi:hypothetical protein
MPNKDHQQSESVVLLIFLKIRVVKLYIGQITVNAKSMYTEHEQCEISRTRRAVRIGTPV